jgi:hypothetical protein
MSVKETMGGQNPVQLESGMKVTHRVYPSPTVTTRAQTGKAQSAKMAHVERVLKMGNQLTIVIHGRDWTKQESSLGAESSKTFVSVKLLGEEQTINIQWKNQATL